MSHATSSGDVLPPRHARGNAREVLALAWPVVVSTISLTVMAAADTYFAGWLGTNEQAAVGFCGTMIWTLYAFFVGTLEIVQTFVAQYTGARDPERAARFGTAGLHAGLAFSIVILPVAFLGEAPFRAMGIAPEMIPAATTYSCIRIAGTAPFFLGRALEGYYRGIGDTITPMKVAVLANLLNVALCWLFVVGYAPLEIPPMGVAGLGWATVIATAVQWLALAFVSERRRHRGEAAPRHFRPSRLEDLREFLRVGAPAGVHWLLDISAWALFNVGVARLAAAQSAANVIAISLLRASFMPGFAVGTAAQTLVGRYLGAGDIASAARAGWTSMWIACAYMGTLAAVFLLFGGTLFALFTRDAAVLMLGTSLMRWAAAFQVGDAIQVVLAGALRGAGDTRFVMWVSFGSAWGVFVPLSWWLLGDRGMGVQGGWMACVAWVVALAVPLVFRFRGDKWRKSLVHAEEPRLHPECEVA
jgi:MATE family multidrug resistance protein